MQPACLHLPGKETRHEQSDLLSRHLPSAACQHSEVWQAAFFFRGGSGCVYPADLGWMDASGEVTKRI